MSPQVCHTPDEANPEGPCPRHLHQTAGGGEGEEGQLRPRGEAPGSPSLCPALLYLHKPLPVSLKQTLSQEELRRVWIKGVEVDPSKAATGDRKGSWLLVV